MLMMFLSIPTQIIRNGALDQLKNEVDIQTVCGHHPFVVQCIAFWQTHRQICIRKCCGGPYTQNVRMEP